MSTFLCKFHLLFTYLHSVSTQLSSPLDPEIQQHITMLKACLDTKMFKQTTMLILTIYIHKICLSHEDVWKSGIHKHTNKCLILQETAIEAVYS